MPSLPLDMRDMLSSGAKLRAERQKSLRLAVLVDVEAADSLIDGLKTALHPQTGSAMLHVEVVRPGELMGVEPTVDAVIGIVGPGSALAGSLRRSRDQAIPTVAVALGASRDTVARRIEHPLLDTLVEEDVEKVVVALGRWLGDRVAGKRIALAANFAFVRRAVAEEAVKSTAFQNGVIGGVAFIPGADLPLMTANQAKMVMQIAAAYGEPLGAERVKEIAGVVGGAFALRTVARQFVGLVPGFGWAIKAGIGYSGTLAMGYATIEYFESGGDVRGLADRLKEAREHAVEVARTRIKRPVLPAQHSATEAALPAPEPVLPAARAEFELPQTEPEAW